MRKNLSGFREYQVFLNYPYDADFTSLEYAFHFAVIASGLIPVCARDLSVPDRPRLQMLMDAITNCAYSAHELSRCTGEGVGNFARMNMPIEMGMALFHALQTQHQQHRCAFFVPTSNDYHLFASDLSGLDAKCHHNDPKQLISEIYDWLRGVVPKGRFNSVSTVEIREGYEEFLLDLQNIRGSGRCDKPAHDEVQELMYQNCANCDWWDLRKNRVGLDEFPSVPLARW